MYLYELPTTGAISFADFCVDHTNDKIYSNHITEVTQARANIRAALKTSKRTEDSAKDYLTLTKLLEDYIPLLRGLIGCVAHDDISLKSEPSFSWRTTLSNNIFHNSPRLSIPGLYADLSFTLLTYAFTLCNLAHANVASLGLYERDNSITEAQRKRKDEELDTSFKQLCKAGGVFTYVADTLLTEWEVNRGGGISGFARPPDLKQEVITALVKLSLADAQNLFIRRYLSKAAYESNVTPGPPLPKSHPSPSLLAKIHLECVSLYSSANSLAKSGNGSEVSAELRKYLTDKTALHTALAHKWMGVEAAERGGAERAGEAVGYLAWSKKEIEDLKAGNPSSHFGKSGKEKARKSRVANELESVIVFYKYYKKMNDTLYFQPVPAQNDLQARIPTGSSAAQVRPYTPPSPAFGPGSLDEVRRKAESLHRDESHTVDSEPVEYAGAGSYY